MRGIRAHIRAERDRMRVRLQKAQVRPVGVIHQKKYAARVADGGKRRDIYGIAQVIGAGQIDRRRRLGHSVKRGGKRRRRDGTGEVGCRPFGREPCHLDIQKRGGGEERAVRVAPCQYHGLLPLAPRPLGGELQHRADGVRGALGGVISPRTEKVRGVFLALADDAIRFIERIRARDLGNIQRLYTERPFPLMPRHMQAERVGGGVAAQKIKYRRFHAFSVGYARSRP